MSYKGDHCWYTSLPTSILLSEAHEKAEKSEPSASGSWCPYKSPYTGEVSHDLFTPAGPSATRINRPGSHPQNKTGRANGRN